MKIAIINGPNLNLLGKRETDIYGNKPFEVYLGELQHKYPHIHLFYFQSNVEGELINELQRIGFEYDGIIFNPGGYTHTSVAIGDAIAAIKTLLLKYIFPMCMQEKISERFLMFRERSTGSIFGLGLKGYELALEWFVANASK